MAGLNEPELFKKVKHYNLKFYYHKVSAALLSALPLYVHLTPYIKFLDSDNEITSNVSSEGDESHTLTVTLIPAGNCPGSVMFLLASKKICSFHWRLQTAKWSYETNQSFRSFTRSCCSQF